MFVDTLVSLKSTAIKLAEVSTTWQKSVILPELRWEKDGIDPVGYVLELENGILIITRIHAICIKANQMCYLLCHVRAIPRTRRVDTRSSQCMKNCHNSGLNALFCLRTVVWEQQWHNRYFGWVADLKTVESGFHSRRIK